MTNWKKISGRHKILVSRGGGRASSIGVNIAQFAIFMNFITFYAIIFTITCTKLVF